MRRRVTADGAARGAPDAIQVALIGTALRLRNTIDITTLVLIGVFELVTAPVAAHMVSRAVYRSGQVDKELLVVDELAADRNDSDTRV